MGLLYTRFTPTERNHVIHYHPLPLLECRKSSKQFQRTENPPVAKLPPMKTLLLFLALAVLAGCAAEVVPAGPDTFSVSASGGIYTQSSAGSRAKAFKAANDYCVKRGLVMVPVSVQERPYELGHHTANINLVFRALRPGDPEIKRPKF